MSVLREENTSREDYIQQYRGKTHRSGTEIESTISGHLSCSNFMINVHRMSQRIDLHLNACGCRCTVIINECYNVLPHV